MTLALAAPKGRACWLSPIALCIGAAAPARLEPKATADREAVALSGSLVVTLSLEGPAPLRIESPTGWLAEGSAADWKASPPGPAKVESLAGGRERWSIALRVDPYAVGPGTLRFVPARVAAGSDAESQLVDWPGLEVRVLAAAVEAKPDGARSPAGLEGPPSPPDADGAGHPLRLGAAVASLAVAGLMLAAARRSRRRKPASPHALALEGLARLERESHSPLRSDAEWAGRLSDVLRAFLEGRYGVAATRKSTEESFAADAMEGEWAAAAGGWKPILEACDRVKYAGEPLAVDGRPALVAAAREAVGRSGLPPDPRPLDRHD